MMHFSFSRRRAVAFGLTALLAGTAHAASYELVYTGTFDGHDALNLASAASPSFFAGTTPFTVTAFFDTDSANLAPAAGGPFDGFRAYAPSAATLTVGAASYAIESAATDALAGVAVTIFDKNSFEPGRYGIGLFVNPAGDGAGFVGDFGSATPDYTASAVTATTYGNYFGVGYLSGVCSSGSGPGCPRITTPWVLSGAGGTYSLTLGNYDDDAPGGVVNTAQILAVAAVPEPATYGLMLAGLGGVAVAARRRKFIA